MLVEEALGHVAPGSARTEHPKHAVGYQPIIYPWASAPAGFTENVRSQIPGCVGKFVPLGCRGLLPMMNADLSTDNCWVQMGFI